MSEPTISLEYQIPEPLFRQFQQALDRYPNASADCFITEAMRRYLLFLDWLEKHRSQSDGQPL